MYYTSWSGQPSSMKSFLGLLLRYVASWIDQRERQTERAHLTILFEKYVPRCLEKMRNSFKTITPIPENSMVQVHNTYAFTIYSYLLFVCLYCQKITIKFPSRSDALHFARLSSNTRKYSVWFAAWAVRDLLHLRLHLGLWWGCVSRSGITLVDMDELSCYTSFYISGYIEQLSGQFVWMCFNMRTHSQHTFTEVFVS